MAWESGRRLREGLERGAKRLGLANTDTGTGEEARVQAYAKAHEAGEHGKRPKAGCPMCPLANADIGQCDRCGKSSDGLLPTKAGGHICGACAEQGEKSGIAGKWDLANGAGEQAYEQAKRWALKHIRDGEAVVRKRLNEDFSVTPLEAQRIWQDALEQHDNGTNPYEQSRENKKQALARGAARYGHTGLANHCGYCDAENEVGDGQHSDGAISVVEGDTENASDSNIDKTWAVASDEAKLKWLDANGYDVSYARLSLGALPEYVKNDWAKHLGYKSYKDASFENATDRCDACGEPTDTLKPIKVSGGRTQMVCKDCADKKAKGLPIWNADREWRRHDSAQTQELAEAAKRNLEAHGKEVKIRPSGNVFQLWYRDLKNATNCSACGHSTQIHDSVSRGCAHKGCKCLELKNAYRLKALCDACAGKALKQGAKLDTHMVGTGIDACDECGASKKRNQLYVVSLQNAVGGKDPWNGPSDADVQAKAYEMFKTHWDGLSSSQQDAVYRALAGIENRNDAQGLCPSCVPSWKREGYHNSGQAAQTCPSCGHKTPNSMSDRCIESSCQCYHQAHDANRELLNAGERCDCGHLKVAHGEGATNCLKKHCECDMFVLDSTENSKQDNDLAAIKEIIQSVNRHAASSMNTWELLPDDYEKVASKLSKFKKLKASDYGDLVGIVYVTNSNENSAADTCASCGEPIPDSEGRIGYDGGKCYHDDCYRALHNAKAGLGRGAARYGTPRANAQDGEPEARSRMAKLCERFAKQPDQNDYDEIKYLEQRYGLKAPCAQALAKYEAKHLGRG